MQNVNKVIRSFPVKCLIEVKCVIVARAHNVHSIAVLFLNQPVNLHMSSVFVCIVDDMKTVVNLKKYFYIFIAPAFEA